MAVLAPPPRPPLVAVADNDGLHRVHFRLYQIACTMITVFLTAWFCTLGAVPAIVSLCIAKHILVAILLMGLGVDARENMPL